MPILNFRNKRETVEDLFRRLKKTKRGNAGASDIDCFFIGKTSIELKAHETGTFDIEYIPTVGKRREALLVFMNEAIGEFLFLIEGVPKRPEYDYLYLSIIYIMLSFLILERFL